MTSYKIHSIKNNKKLSFIIEGEDIEQVKQDLSSDGYIVLTIDEFSEENKTPHFIFEALKDNINVTEGRVDALDIFSAYEILRNDYQYTVLKLYPVGVTDIEEQKEIFRNILLLYPNTTTKDKEVVKNKTLTDVDLLKTYLDTLEGLIKKSGIKNTEILLYDIKRAQNISSISSSEEIIKKTIKLLYNNGSLETKRELYVSMAPMAKRVSMVIFPPWFFNFVNTLNDTFLMIMILFGGSKKKEVKKENKKASLFSVIFSSKGPKKNSASENIMFTNKNIFFLMKKKYRSSWLDVFKSQGTYFYFYSLLRQYRPLFWCKKIQEYISVLSLYILFFVILGVILVGGIFSPEFLYFNGFIAQIMSIVVISLVFFLKEV